MTTKPVTPERFSGGSPLIRGDVQPEVVIKNSNQNQTQNLFTSQLDQGTFFKPSRNFISEELKNRYPINHRCFNKKIVPFPQQRPIPKIDTSLQYSTNPKDIEKYARQVFRLMDAMMSPEEDTRNLMAVTSGQACYPRLSSSSAIPLPDCEQGLDCAAKFGTLSEAALTEEILDPELLQEKLAMEREIKELWKEHLDKNGYDRDKIYTPEESKSITGWAKAVFRNGLNENRVNNIDEFFSDLNNNDLHSLHLAVLNNEFHSELGSQYVLDADLADGVITNREAAEEAGVELEEGEILLRPKSKLGGDEDCNLSAIRSLDRMTIAGDHGWQYIDYGYHAEIGLVLSNGNRIVQNIRDNGRIYLEPLNHLGDAAVRSEKHMIVASIPSDKGWSLISRNKNENVDLFTGKIKPSHIKKALKLFKRALKIDPDDSVAIKGLKAIKDHLAGRIKL